MVRNCAAGGAGSGVAVIELSEIENVGGLIRHCLVFE